LSLLFFSNADDLIDSELEFKDVTDEDFLIGSFFEFEFDEVEVVFVVEVLLGGGVTILTDGEGVLGAGEVVSRGLVIVEGVESAASLFFNLSYIESPVEATTSSRALFFF